MNRTFPIKRIVGTCLTVALLAQIKHASPSTTTSNADALLFRLSQALDEHPEMILAKSRVVDSEASLSSIQGQTDWQVDAELTGNGNIVSANSPRDSISRKSDKDYLDLNITLRRSLYDFGVNNLTEKAASLRVQGAEHERNLTKGELASELFGLISEAQAGQFQLDKINATLEDLAALAERVRIRVSQGAAPVDEQVTVALLAINVERSKLEEQARQQNREQQLRQRFPNIELSEATTAFELLNDIDPLQLEQSQKLPLTLASLDVDVARLDLTRTHQSRLPEFNLTLTGKAFNIYDGGLGANEVNASITGRYNLYDGGRFDSDMKRAGAALNAAESTLRIELQQVDSALTEYRMAKQELEGSLIQVIQQIENLESQLALLSAQGNETGANIARKGSIMVERLTKELEHISLQQRQEASVIETVNRVGAWSHCLTRLTACAKRN